MDGETRYHVEDVGRILLQAQDALKDIHSDLRKGATSPSMVRRIDELFNEAESNVRAKAQNVLSSVMRKDVSTLPNIPPPRGTNSARSAARARPTNRAHFRSSSGSSSAGSLQKPPDRPSALSAYGGNESIHSRNTKKLLSKFGLDQEPSRESRHAAIDKRLSNASKRRGVSGTVKKAMVKPHSQLPTINKIDAAAPPPSVSERDINAGLYSMISRGFVPKGTDLGPAFEFGPAPLQASMARVADGPPRRELRPETSTVGSFNVAGLKFDLASPSASGPESHVTNKIDNSGSNKSRPATQSTQGTNKPASQASARSGLKRSKSRANDEEETVVDEFADAVEEIRGYNELLDEFSLHQFIVRKGVTLTDTPEYDSFQRKHSNIWGSVKTVIKYLEELLQLYSIPLAYIDGQKLAQLAVDELTEPTKAALLNCIANRDEVIPIIEATGQRFKADAGETLAACLIQSVWRMHGHRRTFLATTSRLHSAEAIQEMWRSAMIRTAFLAQLWRKRAREKDDMKELQDDLVTSWPLIRHKRRVVVHIPSASYDVEKRRTIYDLRREQNLTIARLCDVKDPTVDVIYVAPFHMHEETVQYWQRVLQIGGVKHARSRFTIVVPENLDRFPSQSLSLAQLLLYSPRALNKIRNLVGSQDAYIVAAGVNDDTERLALELQIPLLGPRSQAAQFYGSCSGATGIFTSAKLMVPHGCRDIYDEQQFLLTLTKLIAAFPLITQWTFKIEGEFGERGIAHIDPQRITGHAKVVKLYRKMQSEPASHWARPEVQQSVQEVILADLEESLMRCMVILREDLYPSYPHFMAAFCASGGAIEAVPPSIRGRPSAGLFIAPTGEVTVLCTHDNMYTSGGAFAVGAFPQTCVPPAAVYGATQAVGRTLFSKGVFGFAEVHFVSWYDKERAMPALWATGLHLQLTRNISSFNLFDFLMRGEFNPVEGTYAVDIGPAVEKGKNEQKTSTSSSSKSRLAIMNKGVPVSSAPEKNIQLRSYVYSDSVRLRRISRLHYGSFFNLCRLEHISFDLPKRSGTVFQLIDSLSRGIFGMLCIAKSSSSALSALMRNLFFIKDQVSASGHGNQGGRTAKPHEMDNFGDIVSCVRALTDNK